MGQIMVGNEQNEGLSTVHEKTEKFEIPFMLIRPFGPFIVKSRLPQELIDDYNEHDVEMGTLDFIAKYSSSFRIIKEIKYSG